MTYQAEARIVCRMYGSTDDVVVGKRTSAARTHPSFIALAVTQRLFAVPPVAVGSVPDDDVHACLARAKTFVADELPAAYSLDAHGALPFPGHAWVEGHWRPTGGGYVSHAFPILRNDERLEEECVFQDSAGKEQTLVLSWWVVVQPK